MFLGLERRRTEIRCGEVLAGLCGVVGYPSGVWIEASTGGAGTVTLGLDPSHIDELNVMLALERMSTSGRVICGGEGSLPGQSGNLFDIICNSTSALWGPMCEDCTEQLLSGMDQQLKGLEEECASYRKLLDSLSKDRATRVFDLNTSNAKLVAMKAEEASLIAELKRLEMEENTLNDELSRKRSELCNAEREREEKLWKKLRDNHR
uniref:Atg6/beclin coiled-coil domain-containing protein n=1 Tax=Parascaris equorum TaxID=6256 RepID=A0A914RI47_PAREQ